MTALHVLTGELLALANDDTLPEDAVRDTLEAIQGSIEEKAKALADWALDMDGDLLKIEAAIDRLNDKKKSIQKRKESLIEYIKNNMEASGIKKIACPLFTITHVDGPKIVEVFDDSLLEDDYVNAKTTITPDKKKIKEALDNGIDVAGARFSTGKTSLRIK